MRLSTVVLPPKIAMIFLVILKAIGRELGVERNGLEINLSNWYIFRNQQMVPEHFPDPGVHSAIPPGTFCGALVFKLFKFESYVQSNKNWFINSSIYYNM